MLGVGWTEMLVIGIVALIVIGPKELPAVMQKIGRFAGTIRRMGSDFQRELNKTTGLDEVRNLRQSITAPLKATTDAIRKEFNTTTSTGTVQPSGVLKPADPANESVVDEIRAAAGMTPAATVATSAAVTAPVMTPKTAAAEPVKAPGDVMRDAMSTMTSRPAAAQVVPASTDAVAMQAVEAAPVRPKRAPRAKAAPAAKVETAELPPVEAKAAPKPRTKKAAPVAAELAVDAAPAKRKRTRTVAAAAAPAEPATAEAPQVNASAGRRNAAEQS